MSDTEIQVFIKGIAGSTSNIIIDKNARVAELFEKFSEHIGLSGEFGLVYGGKELKSVDPDGKVTHIKDYGIKDESNIGAVMRLPGGSENEKKYDPKVKLSEKTDMLGIDDQAIDMPCGHAIGPTSMTHYVQTEVKDKQHTICCPAMVDDTKNETCRQPWEYKKIQKVALFTKNERTDVEGKISDNYIQYALKSQQCPKCKSNCVRKNKGNPRVICIYCSATSKVRFEFCWICLREWRTPGTNTCGNENCENVSIKFLRDCPTKEIIGVECPSARGCPLCGTLIKHTINCKHMTCIVCKGRFCFICLKVCKDGKWECGSDTSCTVASRQFVLP